MREITDDVIESLKADTELMKMIKGGVHWVKPPGETYNYPFLTVIEASNTPQDYSDDDEYTSIIDISVEIFSAGVNLKPIKDAICRVMIANGFERQSSGPDEFIDANTVRCYHKTLNFSKKVMAQE
jgi:hypothetical protein